MSLGRLQKIIWLALLLALPCERQAVAYSLLTHEQLIDLTWKESIVPLLLSHYPNLTAAQLDEARSYTYGGCVIQDIGYYPFGDVSYSNLTHYVRSGDFVVNLFRNAQNVNELAFAVGALSHYVGDSIGHSQATNVAVPVEFPKLREEYGPVVSYAEGKHQHVRTEFGFDIEEISHHRMAPIHYLRHIGLRVPVRQLALAYYQTYGIAEKFSGGRARRFNIPGYRFAARNFIPRIAYAVTMLHRRHEPADPNTPEMQEFANEVAAVAADDNWQHYRRKAGIGTYVLAGIIFVIPKFGPLTLVAVKGPTESTEGDYIHSVILSTAILRRVLARFTPPSSTHSLAPNTNASDNHAAHAPVQVRPGDPAAAAQDLLQSRDPRHPLPDRDLDTGRVVQPGAYSLMDSTYANLLHRLTRHPERPIPPGIKENILAYYANPDLPITTKKDPKKWAQVQADLATLKAMPTSTEPQPFPTYGDSAPASE
ncbi:MAG: zinc dependent phospholipase C family protein [Terracidiphilus sp.]